MNWSKVIERLREQSKANYKYASEISNDYPYREATINKVMLLGNIQSSLATALETGLEKSNDT